MFHEPILDASRDQVLLCIAEALSFAEAAARHGLTTASGTRAGACLARAGRWLDAAATAPCASARNLALTAARDEAMLGLEVALRERADLTALRDAAVKREAA